MGVMPWMEKKSFKYGWDVLGGIFCGCRQFVHRSASSSHREAPVGVQNLRDQAALRPPGVSMTQHRTENSAFLRIFDEIVTAPCDNIARGFKVCDARVPSFRLVSVTDLGQVLIVDSKGAWRGHGSATRGVMEAEVGLESGCSS